MKRQDHSFFSAEVTLSVSQSASVDWIGFKRQAYILTLGVKKGAGRCFSSQRGALRVADAFSAATTRAAPASQPWGFFSSSWISVLRARGLNLGRGRQRRGLAHPAPAQRHFRYYRTPGGTTSRTPPPSCCGRAEVTERQIKRLLENAL